MKKTIAILLLLCTLLGMLAACKDDPETTEDDTDEVETDGEKEHEDGLPNVDMNGFELNIMTYDDDWFTWAETTIAPEGSYSGNVLYEEMFERNAYIEERFNCFLNVSTQTNITNTNIQNWVLGGEDVVDVVMFYDKWVLDSAAYFHNFDDLYYVDLSQNYWNPNVTQMFKINGKQIAASGAFSLGMLSRTMVTVFNKEIYTNRFGDVSSMYAYVDNNEWTLEKLYELGAEVVFSQDDVWDTKDQYGISASKKTLYTALMVGSGIQFVQKGKDGIPEFKLSGDALTLDKLQKILVLNQDNHVYYDTSNDPNMSDPENFFEDEHTLFGFRVLDAIPTARALMDAEFGIVPVPKYNSEQKSYYSICAGGDVACLMKTVSEDRMDNIGILLEALAYDSQQNLIPLYKIDLLKTRYASDPDSSAMLDIVFESAYSDIGVNIMEDAVSLYLIKNVFQTGKDTFSSHLAVMEMGIPEIIAQKIKNIE
ncbi:MAG: hypothetical protein IJZ80_02070 [Clostridia bacterium]|nr:hypothetical protein [Clostridia bacterium]